MMGCLRGCFSWCRGSARSCTAAAGGAGDDGADEARAGLEDIIRGYHRVAKSGCSPHTAHLIANVRRSIVEFEKAVESGTHTSLKPRPGSLPMTEEQEDWEAVHPGCGFLLKRQHCMASLGDEDWSMGCLFMSDLGLVFDTGDVPCGSAPLSTSFMPWSTVLSIIRPSPSVAALSNEVVLSVDRRARSHAGRLLHLQLNTEEDVGWLLEFWEIQRNSVGAGAKQNVDVLPVRDVRPDEGEAFSFLFCCLHRKLDSEGDIRPNAVPPREYQVNRQPSILVQRRSTMNPGARRAMGGEAQVDRRSSLTNVFVSSSQGLPTAEMPQNEDPIYTMRIADLTLASVHAALRSNSCMQRFMQDSGNARNFECTPWASSSRMPGTMVRRILCEVPVSIQIPQSLRSFAAMPEMSGLTEVFRLRAVGNTVVQTSQYCIHDVPYGESFRIQETIAFETLPDGGVEYKKWAEVIWVTPLPWILSPAKAFVEAQTCKELTETAKYLPPILADLSSKVEAAKDV